MTKNEINKIKFPIFLSSTTFLVWDKILMHARTASCVNARR